MGVDEAIGDAPVNRYDLPEAAKPGSAAAVPSIPAPAPGATDRVYATPQNQPVSENLETAIMAARAAAATSETLADLRAAMQDFDHCDLKRGARNLVFAGGNPNARVMIITDAPDVTDDREGRPFTGQSGDLLDRMFAAIGLSRSDLDPAAAIYITPALPWRTPQDSEPADADLAMVRPFLDRHIQLVNPDVIVLMGNTPLRALLDSTGIVRLRGEWRDVANTPALPMVHPAHLLRNPTAKRDAWADLLALQARLRDSGV